MPSFDRKWERARVLVIFRDWWARASVAAIAASIGVMCSGDTPATIIRYSASAVGIVPMGRGFLLGMPSGYAKICNVFAEEYSGELVGGSEDRLFS